MSTEVIDMETGDIVEISNDVSGYVAQSDAAALDVQVSTAKKFPRSIQRFQSDLEAWSCFNRDTAMECFFNLRRGSSSVVGPSIRFAELVQAAWGNMIVDVAIVTEAHDHVVVAATCRDLERNTASRAQIRRNIVTKHGKRYGTDMIQTTIQAASAIARRNAIFQIVPKALWVPLFEKAKSLASSDTKGESFSERRVRILKALKEAGAVPEHVKHSLGGKEQKDMTADDILLLEVSLN